MPNPSVKFKAGKRRPYRLNVDRAELERLYELLWADSEVDPDSLWSGIRSLLHWEPAMVRDTRLGSITAEGQRYTLKLSQSEARRLDRLLTNDLAVLGDDDPIWLAFRGVGGLD